MIITLNPSYLNTLNTGVHSIQAVFANDVVAESRFITVKAGTPEDYGGSDQDIDNTNGNTNSNNNTNSNANTNNNANGALVPNTGENGANGDANGLNDGLSMLIIYLLLGVAVVSNLMIRRATRRRSIFTKTK